MSTSRIVRFSTLLAVLIAAVPPPRAAAQLLERPVTIEVHGVFGDELVLPDRWIPLTATLTNRSRRAYRGELELEITDYRAPRRRHVLPVDLPAGAARTVQVTYFRSDTSGTVRARYRDDADRVLGERMLEPSYSPAIEGVVTLSDPPRLRPALLDLQVEQVATTTAWGSGGPRVVAVPVGAIQTDARTGDPILPQETVGWSAAALFVASAPMLPRISARERAVIADWLRSGGQMLVFPRTPADLSDPWLRSLVGSVELFGAESTLAHEAFVPPEGRGTFMRGDHPAFRPESFGGSVAVGFGRVWLATYDGAAPSTTDNREVRELVRSILAAPRETAPLYPFGRQTDSMGDSSMVYGPYGSTFASLRAALDPNEGYEPALALVAILLIFYVIVVGPVNFTIVGKKNRPTLALITTPIVAIACTFLLLGIGYVGKGTRMRHRTVQILELMEGEREGPARRYSGLFLTRPAGFDLAAPARGALRVINAGDRAGLVEEGSERPILRDVRGRLWETVFVREDVIGDAGGQITFERDGRRLAAVRNRTPFALRGVVVVDAFGAVYRVGDVAPGGLVPIPTAATMTIGASGSMFWGPEDPNLHFFADALGVDRDDRDVVLGIVQLAGNTLASPAVPTLFGRIETPHRGEVAGVFGEESEQHFVRVVPRLGQSSLTRAPDVVPPTPIAGDTPVPPPVLAPEDAGEDGGQP